MHKKFPLSKVKENPFRHMDRYPINEKKINDLMESMDRTGFWENLMGRSDGNGGIELAYGHHRWIAFGRKFGKKAEMNVFVNKLNDEAIIKAMADENMADYNMLATVEQETIRAVVEAYANPKADVDLNKKEYLDPKTNKGLLRYAPYFTLTKCGGNSPPHPYTALSIAKFLGWVEKNQGKEKATARVRNALRFLAGIENKIVTVKDAEGLTSDEANEVVAAAENINNKFQSIAKGITDPVEKKKIEKKGKKSAKEVGKKLANKARPDKKTGEKVLSRRAMQVESKEIIAEVLGSKPKGIPTVENFISKLSKRLRGLLGADDKSHDDIQKIVDFRKDIEEPILKNLLVELKGLKERCDLMIDDINGSPRKLKSS